MPAKSQYVKSISSMPAASALEIKSGGIFLDPPRSKFLIELGRESGTVMSAKSQYLKLILRILYLFIL